MAIGNSCHFFVVVAGDADVGFVFYACPCWCIVKFGLRYAGVYSTHYHCSTRYMCRAVRALEVCLYQAGCSNRPPNGSDCVRTAENVCAMHALEGVVSHIFL